MARAVALFQLTGAVLFTDGPIRSLVELSLEPKHRRGHDELYEGINRGRIDRMAETLCCATVAESSGGSHHARRGRVPPWLQLDANTAPKRSFGHTRGHSQGQHLPVPGWPSSIVAALQTDRSSWTALIALLDAVRLTRGLGERCGLLSGFVVQLGRDGLNQRQKLNDVVGLDRLALMIRPPEGLPGPSGGLVPPGRHSVQNI